MRIRSCTRTIIWSVVGLLLLFGASSLAAAQRKGNNPNPKPGPQKIERKPITPIVPPQQVITQQPKHNQQRYEERARVYKQGQQGWSIQKKQIEERSAIKRQDPNVIKKVRDPNLIPAQEELRILNQNRQNDYVLKQRRANNNDLRRITDHQKQWRQNEQSWHNNYNSHWSGMVNVFTQGAELLMRQNRRHHLDLHRSYWDRVQEDRNRLQYWTYYDDVGLPYSYYRSGVTYYTSQYGMNMIRDAVNDGYQQGFLAGQADREDGWRSDYLGSLEYQDATYGYNGYWIGLDEYQYYFRQGFERGYRDGYNGRYQYGRYDNNRGLYILLDNILNTIVSFVAVTN